MISTVRNIKLHVIITHHSIKKLVPKVKDKVQGQDCFCFFRIITAVGFKLHIMYYPLLRFEPCESWVKKSIIRFVSFFAENY